MNKLLSALALLGLTALGLHAQSTSLSGSVADPSGAVIPGATLTLQNTATGATRDGVSDSQGRYNFVQLTPGTYKLTAKAQGFNDMVFNDIRLLVSQPSTVNVTFEKVGQVQTTVAVVESGAQLNTVDATIGNAIGTKPILQLPLFARSLASLLAFQPGVTSFAEVSGAPLDDRSGSVNGGKSDQANVTLDGVDVNNQNSRTSFTSVLRTTLDSTAEFRTTTSGAGADQGRSSGAQIALVTKSGSNDWHGSLYYVHRNTITAANSFFNNASGVKRPPLLINIPGASIGGPIAKNKLFFFLNYETRRDASSSNQSRTVPSLLMREGGVRYINTAGAIVTATAADMRRFDPAGIGPNAEALKVLQQYPAPNDNSLGDGLNIVGYRFSAPIQGKFDTYISRFDYQISAKHSLFARGQLQNDRNLGPPQFPGQPPRSAALTNAKGIALGHTWLVSNSLVSNFRYGLTRQSTETTGVQNASAVTFRNIDPIFGQTRGVSRQIPVHNVNQDFSWNKGAHDVRFGGSMRWISNASSNYANSFHIGSANLSWLRGTGADLQPADISTANRVAYGDAAMAVLGIVSSVTARYNFNIDGSVVPLGAPVKRKFANEEYEWYVSDSWRLRRNLTLTLGVRHSLMPPIYETNGQQLSTNIPIGDWFNTRGGLAERGLSQAQAGKLSYIVAGQPGGRDIYPFRKANFAPRASLAWSPGSDSGPLNWLTGGPGKTSVRMGWGQYYDLIGQPLTFTYDQNAFGLAIGLTNPAGQLTALTAPRFTGFNGIPTSLLRAAPAASFPATPPDNFAITNSIDDKLNTPYVMRSNLSIGREFKGGLFIEASYVNSLSRRSLINRDLAMPTNLKDPASGQTYFQAATALALALRQGVNVANLPSQPFFQKFFANLAGNGRTATQNVYQEAVRFYPNDFTSALADLDQFCDPDCGLSPNQMLNAQFSALSAWSSIGSGSYHAFQFVARKRFGQGLTLDFNYSLAKSIDLASRAENGGSFSGFIVNSWETKQRRAVSDYDQRHIANMFAIWEVPVGKNKKWGNSMSMLGRVLAEGWQLSPTFQTSTALPTSVGNGRNWPTNWNITGYATPEGAYVASSKTSSAVGIDGRAAASLYSNPQAARNSWNFTLPGQSGSRNTVRVDGVFNLNLGVGKRFPMPKESHSFQIRWETFNVTNTNRFDGVNLDLGNVGAFGRFTSSLSSPRQMQFLARYEF
jgi:hypothetical protein